LNPRGSLRFDVLLRYWCNLHCYTSCFNGADFQISKPSLFHIGRCASKLK
jgi:hypothetical protein